MLWLINDIVSMAKLEAGRLDLYIRDVTVRDGMSELDVSILPQLKRGAPGFDYQGRRTGVGSVLTVVLPRSRRAKPVHT
ncbi:MAG TPA: hypothetical protein VH277_10245 [Gemmatimonadaceae bacterium]|nr:hypothetical protein [Gemmatimonadaceae bacterium]